MYVAEFSLQARMGHYTDVSNALQKFVETFLSTHAALESVLVVGDPASGLVRAIGVWDSKADADKVTSDPAFAAFNDGIAPHLASTADRQELELLKRYSR